MLPTWPGPLALGTQPVRFSGTLSQLHGLLQAGQRGDTTSRHCSDFSSCHPGPRQREKTSFIMPENLGKGCLDLVGERVCGPSASLSLGLQVPTPPDWETAERPNSGEPHSQPQTDLSWPDPQKAVWKRGWEVSEGSFFHCLTPEKRGERQPRGSRKKQVGSPTLQPPVSPPDSSCQPKITKPFPSKPKGKKEREREESTGKGRGSSEFQKEANLCSAGQPYLHNEMCRGCLAHVFFRRFNFNFI